MVETSLPGRLYAEQVSKDLELVHNKKEYRAMKGIFATALYLEPRFFS